MDELAVRAILARTPGLKSCHVEALVRTADGDIGRVLDSSTRSCTELPPRTASFLASPDRRALQDDLIWAAESGARLLLSTDCAYPELLRHIPNPPPVLFVLGDPTVLAGVQLAMVGARHPTPVGRRTAYRFARLFAQAGLTVTSGLAVGIDAASHEGALSGGGITIAVCATGLDRIYPTQHGPLAARIRARGALISEFPPRTPPYARNFPQRNRLISGLARGTLVIEAARRSGSLITARHAADQGREVFALPGSIYNTLASGCHKLIRDGAALVEEPLEVLAALKIPLPEEVLVQGTNHADTAPALDKEYEMLLDAVGFEPATLDVLAARTGFPGESIASMLLILELEGQIAPCAGGRYSRIPR